MSNFPDPDTIKVHTRVCWICSKDGHAVLPREGLVAYNKGALIQEAFPNVPVEVREQFQTGLHPKCQDEIFGSDDDKDK